MEKFVLKVHSNSPFTGENERVVNFSEIMTLERHFPNIEISSYQLEKVVTSQLTLFFERFGARMTTLSLNHKFFDAHALSEFLKNVSRLKELSLRIVWQSKLVIDPTISTVTLPKLVKLAV